MKVNPDVVESGVRGAFIVAGAVFYVFGLYVDDDGVRLIGSSVLLTTTFWLVTSRWSAERRASHAASE